MKKSLCFLMIIFYASITSAGELPVSNPKLDVNGNNVNLNFDVSGDASSRDVKVLFKGETSSGLSENTELQPYFEWYISSDTNKTTMKEMILNGWKLQQVIPYNATGAKQFYIVFVK